MHVFRDVTDKYFEKPISKKQKNILDAFEVATPNRYNINFFIKNILK
jgi:hypothetical protein